MNRPTDRGRWAAVLVPAVVAALGIWSVVPVPVALVGTDPGLLAGAWRLWGWGALITAGVTVVAHILSRGAVSEAVVRLWQRLRAIPTRRFTLVGCVLFAVGTLAFTLFVFAGNPRNVDGFAQLFQARIFLGGRTWQPPPDALASFGILHMILGPGRWYAQYPPGQSAVLAAGLAFGAWWLLVPVWAAALAWCTHRLAVWTGGDGTGRVALLLLCVSPFALAVSGSEMSHLPAAVLGAAAAVAATRTGGARWVASALFAGAALGFMTGFRPLDAVAAAVPVGVLTLMVARRRVAALACTAVGGIAGTLPTLWYNALTTGSWRTFGYSVLWGPDHSLGFHAVPFGIPLTPLRAVGLSSLDLFQVNQYLVDLPVPVLVLTGAAYVMGRRDVQPRDGVPVAGLVALTSLLFFYWHRDVFYGPRFLFSALPWMIVLVARGVVLLGAASRYHRALALAPTLLVAGLGVGVVLLSPDRLVAYRSSTPTLDLHPDRDAARAGIGRSVVLIPDGWGSRLVARMWESGVPVRASTTLYAAIDACTLEQALDGADADPALGARLGATLDSLAALRRPGVPGMVPTDPALRLQPGARLPAACVAELAFDAEGVLAFAPFLYLNDAGLDGDIVWARDLRDRNDRLLARYPGRSVWRYRRPAPDAAPAFEPVSDPALSPR